MLSMLSSGQMYLFMLKYVEFSQFCFHTEIANDDLEKKTVSVVERTFLFRGERFRKRSVNCLVWLQTKHLIHDARCLSCFCMR